MDEWTECDEVAENIFAGLITPIETYADAEAIAARALHDQGATIQANVAEALWRLAMSARFNP
jgi:hypothetical protein